MELSKKEYTKDEKSEMFDYVNSTFFKLKGDKRKALRKAILTWKQNKQVGAFELFVMLYHSEDLYDEKNEWFKEYVDETGLTKEETKKKKPIPYVKHVRRMRWKDKEIEEAQEELESVLEDKNLISKEEHEEIVDKIKADNKELKESLEHKIQQLEQQLNFAKESAEAKIRIANERANFFENECMKLSTSSD